MPATGQKNSVHGSTPASVNMSQQLVQSPLRETAHLPGASALSEHMGAGIYPGQPSPIDMNMHELEHYLNNPFRSAAKMVSQGSGRASKNSSKARLSSP